MTRFLRRSARAKPHPKVHRGKGGHDVRDNKPLKRSPEVEVDGPRKVGLRYREL